MPNKENIRKWVDALRSGDYAQTTECLKDHKGYCCLGVACEVYGKEIGESFSEDGVFLGEDGVLPLRVMDWLGLKFPNPEFGGNYASAHNDEYGRTFAEIADLIEAEYL